MFSLEISLALLIIGVAGTVAGIRLWRQKPRHVKQQKEVVDSILPPIPLATQAEEVLLPPSVELFQKAVEWLKGHPE